MPERRKLYLLAARGLGLRGLWIGRQGPVGDASRELAERQLLVLVPEARRRLYEVLEVEVQRNGVDEDGPHGS